MRRPRIVARPGLLALAGLLGAFGCTHNHYYGYSPGPVCLTPADPAAIELGSPSGPPSVVVTEPPMIVERAPADSRVVISQPSGGGGLSGRPRGWFRSDPDRLATTEVRGSLDLGPDTVR